MPKKSRQKFKYLENEKRFYDEIKSIFHHFWRAIIEANKKNFFEGKSPTLRISFDEFDSLLHLWNSLDFDKYSVLPQQQ